MKRASGVEKFVAREKAEDGKERRRRFSFAYKHQEALLSLQR